jgi:hypothetical protein
MVKAIQDNYPNPAVATAKTGHGPQPQPIAEKEVVPKQMMCAAVGNCWQ